MSIFLWVKSFFKRSVRVYAPEFIPGQKLLETYSDDVVVGRWGVIKLDDTGQPLLNSFKNGGNLTARTVKFQDADGSVHTDHTWQPEE